jgi:uncharacterized protein YaiI (UPF0178 family)
VTLGLCPEDLTAWISDASVCPVVVQEDVVLSLLEAQLSVISVAARNHDVYRSAASSISTVTVYCFGIVA